jgi:hypothetical protein
MSQASAGTEGTPSSPRRKQRRVAGVIAQYIHELSERHREEARADPRSIPAEETA